jgi:hypothetical protein
VSHWGDTGGRADPCRSSSVQPSAGLRLEPGAGLASHKS